MTPRKAFRCVALLSYVLVVRCSLADSGSKCRSSRLLESGKPIEREIAGGQSLLYHITLTAGQYLVVIAEQNGIDLVMSAFGPDGKTLVEVDSPNGSYGPEPVRLIAAVAGEYRIEAKSPDKRAAAVPCVVRIAALRLATAQDESMRFRTGTLCRRYETSGTTGDCISAPGD